MKLYLFILLIFIAGCGGGTTTGNPVKTVNVQMQDQQPFAWIKKLSDSLVNPAYALTNTADFCFKRMRFKPDSSTSGSNFDLLIGQKTISAAATSVVSAAVPEGVYRRIEFDLEPNCDGSSKPSVQFTNNNGTFNTNDTMTIKFEGVYTVNADGTLVLNVDALFDAMDTVTVNTQIKTVLEASTGDY